MNSTLHKENGYPSQTTGEPPVRRLKQPLTIRWDHHRSGWPGVQTAVAERLIHDDGDCLFLGELEDCVIQSGPFREPWIGVAHQVMKCPPAISRIYGGCNDYDFLLNHHPNLKPSLPYCQGIFTLSEHVADGLRRALKVPVDVLRLPTESNVPQFSFDAFCENHTKSIIQLGQWLRQLHLIYDLPVRGYRRIWLAGMDFPHRRALRREGHRSSWFTRVECPRRLSNADYDQLLTENVAIVGLWEANANNSIVECLARGTPVLTNPLPAVKEYLGDEYPFYFQNLDEAAKKLSDLQLIKSTAQYLQERQSHLWSVDRVLSEMMQSAILH